MKCDICDSPAKYGYSGNPVSLVMAASSHRVLCRHHMLAVFGPVNRGAVPPRRTLRLLGWSPVIAGVIRGDK